MNNSFRAKPIGDVNFSPIGFAASQNQTPNDAHSGIAREKFVVFFLSERLFGISTAEIAEVSPPLSVAALPGAPIWLFGVANLRGEIITVLNLAKILGGKLQTGCGKTKFIVLKTKKFDTPIAFPVDRLSEISILGDQSVSADKTSPLIFARCSYQNKEICLIDTEQLFRLIAPE